MEIISEKNVCVYICICITESLCYILETNTTLQINSISIFFFFFFSKPGVLFPDQGLNLCPQQ